MLLDMAYGIICGIMWRVARGVLDGGRVVAPDFGPAPRRLPLAHGQELLAGVVTTSARGGAGVRETVEQS